MGSSIITVAPLFSCSFIASLLIHHYYYCLKPLKFDCFKIKLQLTSLTLNPVVYGEEKTKSIYILQQLNRFHYLRANWIESLLIDSESCESNLNWFRELATILSPFYLFIKWGCLIGSAMKRCSSTGLSVSVFDKQKFRALKMCLVWEETADPLMKVWIIVHKCV